jgi:hypothetical protein
LKQKKKNSKWIRASFRKTIQISIKRTDIASTTVATFTKPTEQAADVCVMPSRL